MPSFPPHAADRRFYAAMSMVASVVILTGFANTYGPKMIAGSRGVPGIVHVHAGVFVCWLVLFVAQTLLIVRGRVQAHMRLGRAGLALAGVMLVTGLATAIAAARAGHSGIPGVEFPDPQGFLLLNVASILVFSLLVVAGWWWRRRPEAHKRLMLAATVAALLPPGISRFPGIAGHDGAIAAVAVAFLLVGPAYDLATRKRIHPAYAGLLLSVFIVPPVVLGLSGTEAWRAAAAWMMR
ncbi:MAG: hypothetical protein WCS72_14655 [Deltaproteobacteria bacterium]